MLSVKGVYENGAARPSDPVEGREVIITFLENEDQEQSDDAIDADWDALMHLIEETKIETGIGDLAHQHDHYLYGTPKKP
jgi:hypothetical protein